jgi:hypothetical protein
MLMSPHGLIGRYLHKRSLARWKAAARHVYQMDMSSLEAQSRMAHQVLRDARKFKVAADDRLAMPRQGVDAIARPTGTDWSWRPEIWRQPVPGAGVAPVLPKDSLSKEVLVFHDCKTTEICIRQKKNIRETDISAYGLDLEVFHFDGSYLSVVIEIPPSSCEGLRRNHLIRLAAMIESERPTPIYVRLNVKHGPNTEQVLLTLPDDQPDTMVEFDLAYSQLNEKRAERMWLDLMIERPAMNKITIRDLTLCRYPRAEI